jgi:diguanylate cyclase (GGDEF)-like protein
MAWVMSPTPAATDARRLDAIARLGVLQRAGDPLLTGVTRLAAFIAGSDAAAIHVFDAEYQHRVAAHRAALGPHPREDAMCRLVVEDEQRIVCADATLDGRFGYSSFVAGPTPVRFYVSLPLVTSAGTVIGSLCAFDTAARDVTEQQLTLLDELASQAAAHFELRQIAAELGQAAAHDPLTGAVNRLMLGDRLAQAGARRLRREGHLLVVVIDIDAFKQLNDELGHAAGDEVLVCVAQRLMGSLRAEDTVARLGGDEFVVLAEIAEEAEAAAIVEQRIATILAEPMRVAGRSRHVSISLGAVLAEPGEDVAALVARADAAMYRHKARPRRHDRAGASRHRI